MPLRAAIGVSINYDALCWSRLQTAGFTLCNATEPVLSMPSMLNSHRVRELCYVKGLGQGAALGSRKAAAAVGCTDSVTVRHVGTTAS